MTPNNQLDTTPLTDEERYDLMHGDGCSEPDYGTFNDETDEDIESDSK